MEIFKLFGSIFVDSGQAEKNIKSTSSKAGDLAKNLGKGVAKAGLMGAAIAGAAVAGTKALLNLAENSAGVADNIDKMSQKIGVSAEAYQELDYICNLSGASVDGLKNGIKTLTSQMNAAKNGTAKSVDAFKKLGIAYENADGSLRNQEETMWDAFEALQGVEDQTEKAMLAQQLFGKSGQDLMPLLNGEAGSIAKMKKEAHDLGLILSDEDVKAGADFNDSMYKLKTSFDMIKTKIGFAVMPAFQSLSDKILEHMPEINESISGAIEGVTGFISDFVDQANNSDTTVGKVWENLKEGAVQKGHMIRGALRLVSNLLKGDFSGAWDSAKDVASSALKGIEADAEALLTYLDSWADNVAKDLEKANTDSQGNTRIPYNYGCGTGVAEYNSQKRTVGSSSQNESLSFWDSVKSIAKEQMGIGNAKALNSAYEFKGNTLIGFDSSGLPYYSGEAGSETLIGTNTLMRSIEQAAGGQELARVFSGYMDQMLGIMEEYLPAIANNKLVMPVKDAAKALAPEIDSYLGAKAIRRGATSV